MRYRIALAVLLASCSGGDAGEGAAGDSATLADTTTSQKEPPPLDSLIAALDSAGGKSIPLDQFRAHGHEAVNRLIDCLPDYKSATHARGILCLEILEALVNVDSSRELGFNQEDLYVSRDPADLRNELKRAQRAWRAVYEAKAYRLKTR